MKKAIDIPKGYKQSPVGVIPKEWEVKKLKDLGEISSGTTPSRKNEEYYINGNIPWVKTTDLNNGAIFSTEEYVTEAAIKECSLKILPKGTILIAMYGGFNQIGRTGLLAIDATVNQAISGIVLYENEFNGYYILQYLNANVYRWKKYAASSRKDPNITGQDVANFNIAIPPTLEQRKIAKLLSAWDKAIELQTSIIDKLILRKRGLMQQLLTGKKRLKGFTEPWKNTRLDNVSERITRKNIYGCNNVVTVSAQKGFVLQTDFFKKTIASNITDNYYLVRKGEFCYNKSYSNGYPMGAIKRLKEYEEAVVTTLYICFSINEKNVVPDFIEQYFECGLMNRELIKVANEGGRAHGLLNVTPKDFFNIKLHLPSLVEQREIAEVLSTTDVEIQKERQKLEALKQQKKGLMQQLLTGKKRVITK